MADYTQYLFQIEEKADYWNYNGRTDEKGERKKVSQCTSVLIIDPQVDFHRGGTFPIEGAHHDSKRIASMIRKNKHLIHNIFVTLESRHRYHISHALFWMNKSGSPPNIFTVISYQDVKNKIWIPRDTSPAVMEWCLSYTKKLEHLGRTKLTIWPEHCIIGSRGQAVVSSINEALQQWAAYSHRPVTYIMKGQNSRTEMYSALEAEVVDPLDYSTALNNELLSMLRMSDKVLYTNRLVQR